MRNGVLAIRKGGEIVLLNAEARRIFGLDPDIDVVGQRYTRILRNHPDILRVLAGAFEMTALPNRAELRLKPTDKVIGYTLSLIRDADADVLGAAFFFKDLTHVEQMEERERLRDRLAAVGQMATTMAHEIKNPLAGIEVLAGLVRRQVPDNETALALVADIISEAKMANAIVQEVLEFVRPVRLQLETTSLSSALQTAVTVADAKVTRGEIAVSVLVSDEIPAITGDHIQLTQVFANLLINAYEALSGHGTIALAARLAVGIDDGALVPDGLSPVPTVVVDVGDDGPGVPPELTDRIFDPFFTTKPQGSGLGLAIVRKIVDAHDGRIDVRANNGRGTCFRVTLPVAHESWTAPQQTFSP
jgi:two-component system, NtrC family, sensor histidine kinase AtoS